MNNVVSNGNFKAFFIENSEKIHTAGCGMIIEPMRILSIQMSMAEVLLEVVWQSCKLKSPL